MGKYSDETIFICDCHSTEHQVVFTMDKELKEFSDEIPMLYMTPHLIKRNFWGRIKYGFKYIFGYKSRFGAFDEIIFQPEDADKLLLIANKLKEIELKHKEREYKSSNEITGILTEINKL